MAWMKPYDLSTTGAVAYAKNDIRIAGCSTPQAAPATAAVSGLSVSKGRMLHWVVNITTDPPVADTYEGRTLAVTTTWQQKSELSLNVSGEVVVKGTGSATKAKVGNCCCCCCGLACSWLLDGCCQQHFHRRLTCRHPAAAAACCRWLRSPCVVLVAALIAHRSHSW